MIFGAVIDDAQRDEVRVTVIATGFGGQRRRRASAPEAGTNRAADPSRRSTSTPGDTLDVPSFLRDD